MARIENCTTVSVNMYQIGYINGINDLLKRIESICGCPYLDCQNTKGNNCNECVEFTVEYSSISDAADELKEQVDIGNKDSK